MTRQSEVGRLRRALLKHARDAFGSQERIDVQWQALGYLSAPRFDAACREYDDFARLLEGLQVRLEWLRGPDEGLDAIYARDASIVSDRGVIPCVMGKNARAGEPAAQRAVLAPDIGLAGEIAGAGTIEGGDVVWLDRETLAVGRGYRTSEGSVRRIRELLPGTEVLRVPLPHWRGPCDVFHLMSILSPLSEDLLLVYSPLLPVPFRETLRERGFRFVEVPDQEFDSQGCNVLAIEPRVVVALDGNPETRRRMEAEGVEVHTYVGQEISLKGLGGPTCLTRTLERG